VEEQQAVRACLRAWWLVCLALVQQEFAEFLAGHSAAGWGDSVGPAYQELTESGLLPAAWLQQTWHEMLQPTPGQPATDYVKSPAFLMLADWLHHFLYRNGIMPLECGRTPVTQGYLEEGFFQYVSSAPQLAQRLSDLLHCLEHSPPPIFSLE
jgi:hypothetical protein